MCAPPSIYTHPFIWYIRVRILSYCHCQWEEGGGDFFLSLFPYFCLSILTIILSWISRSVTEFVVRATSSANLRSVNFLNQCLFLRILVLNTKGWFLKADEFCFLITSKLNELQSSFMAQKKQNFMGFYYIPVMRKSDNYFFCNLL